MLWAPVIASALSAGGAALGKSERPTIDPEMLKQLFGPNALAGDTQALFRNLLNSPAFAEMMRSAGIKGSQLGNNINSNVAAAGVQGNPIAAFAKAAGRGYGTALQLPMQADLFSEALRTALANLSQRANIWGQSQMSRQETPTWNRMVGSSALNAGAAGFSNWFDKAVK